MRGTLYRRRHRQAGPPALRLGKHTRFDPETVRPWALVKLSASMYRQRSRQSLGAFPDCVDLWFRHQEPGVRDLAAPVVVRGDGFVSGLNSSITCVLTGCHRPDRVQTGIRTTRPAVGAAG